MTIGDAQRDVRHAFLGGFAGSLASGLVWLVSAVLATRGSAQLAMAVLVVGGARTGRALPAGLQVAHLQA